MKVAFFSHYTELYGANRSLLNLIEGLKLYNVECYVVVPDEGDLTDALQELEVKYAIFPLQWWTTVLQVQGNYWQKSIQTFKYYYRAARRLFKNISLIEPIASQLNKWNVDVVYTNSSVIPIGAFVAKKLNLPHVWHLREFIDLDYNLNYDLGRKIFNYFVTKAEIRIAISQAIRSHLVRESLFETTPIVYNGIAFQSKFNRLYEQRKSKSNLNRPYTFSLVGLIHPCKGQETAIRALSLLIDKFPNVRLLIVGSGETSALIQLASDLKVEDKVEFWGYEKDPYKAYLNSDALLMCSKNEGMGRVTVEAMSACCPVIGYDNGGTSEIIQHEQTGLLYKGGHYELANSMERLVENPAWAQELGHNAWQQARQNYTIEAYSQSVYQILLLITQTAIQKSEYAPLSNVAN